MIVFFINNKAVRWNEVNFHFQRDPKPGNENFKVCIDLAEIELIEKIRVLAKCDISSPDYLSNLLKCEDGFYNPVAFALSFLRKINPNSSFDITWVLNKITKAYFQNNKLILEGIASKYDPYYFKQF